MKNILTPGTATLPSATFFMACHVVISDRIRIRHGLSSRTTISGYWYVAQGYGAVLF